MSSAERSLFFLLLIPPKLLFELDDWTNPDGWLLLFFIWFKGTFSRFALGRRSSKALQSSFFLGGFIFWLEESGEVTGDWKLPKLFWEADGFQLFVVELNQVLLFDEVLCVNLSCDRLLSISDDVMSFGLLLIFSAAGFGVMAACDCNLWFCSCCCVNRCLSWRLILLELVDIEVAPVAVSLELSSMSFRNCSSPRFEKTSSDSLRDGDFALGTSWFCDWNFSALDSFWMLVSCSSFVRCSPSTRLIISFTNAIIALNCTSDNPFSIESGTRNGITFVAKASFVSPNLLWVNANLYMPRIAMRTAGSRDGICGKKGMISSITNHLSRCSSSFPMHSRQLTRTLTSWVVTQSFLIRGKSAFFIDG